ncbi:MAG: glycosyltransferase family 1 protein [Pelobium sp.]
MKRKTVGIDIRDLRIAKTGARTYLEELIKALKTHSDKHFNYVFLDSYFHPYTGKNKILKLLEHISFFTWKNVILPFKAFFKGCDLVLCTDFFVPYIHLNFKTISVFHDAFFLEYPAHYNKYWLYLFKTYGINAALRAKAVVTPTLYTKKKIAELTKIPFSKLVAIHEAPKSLKINVKVEISDINTSLSDKMYLLHVGTMEKRKNIPNLIRTFKQLSDKYPALKLVLLGQFSPKSDMDDELEILSEIKKLNLKDKIIFPGYVKDEFLSVYYKNALAYIFPSINEGFGLPILEAFAHQIPVLAANNSCLPEVGGDAVVYFDPINIEDMILKTEMILNDESLRLELIKKGDARLKAFSWEKTADQFVNLFHEILEKE